MINLEEGDLRVTLPGQGRATKFDDPANHGVSHCMKAVDFVVEFKRRILFLEIKDPGHPCARSANRRSFLAAFKSDQLDGDLVQKYRDSLLYEWACDNIGKPIHYWILGESTVSVRPSSRQDLRAQEKAAVGDWPGEVGTAYRVGLSGVHPWKLESGTSRRLHGQAGLGIDGQTLALVSRVKRTLGQGAWSRFPVPDVSSPPPRGRTGACRSRAGLNRGEHAWRSAPT